MENFITQLPTTPIGWIAFIFVIAGAVIYFFSRIRKSDMELLRQTNEDQGKRIDFLEEEVKRLNVKVGDLEHANKTLEDLVVVALKQFFFENPEMAKNLKNKILKG